MKKFFTFVIAAAMCGAANAQTFSFVGGGPEEMPQLIVQGISPDGRYICGYTDMGYGYFVADLTNDYLASDATIDEDAGAELRHVANNGLAIGYDGPGITYSISGMRTELVNPSSEYKYVLGEDLTADGKTMVGSLVGTGFVTYAAISVDGGDWKCLPAPVDDVYLPDGSAECAAKCISGDGKYILGYIGNWGPSVAWVRNDAGEYEVLPLYAQYVAMTKEEAENRTKPYAGLMPMAVSNNGKYLLMRGVSIDGQVMPVVYNTETKEVTDYPFVDDYGQGLTPSAIADDGTIVAMSGQLSVTSTCNYIFPAGQPEPISFSELLPECADLFDIPDLIGYNAATAISADGKMVVGFLLYSEDYYDEDIEPFFRTYIIKLDDSGDGITSAEASEATPAAYYTIDGKRLTAPQPGLNVVRMSDGTARKVIVK